MHVENFTINLYNLYNTILQSPTMMHKNLLKNRKRGYFLYFKHGNLFFYLETDYLY